MAQTHPFSLHRVTPQTRGGGDRPIGITAALAAIFIEIYGDFVLVWDEGAMDFWEDAVRGSSSLQAGLTRRLADECAAAVGCETAAV